MAEVEGVFFERVAALTLARGIELSDELATRIYARLTKLGERLNRPLSAGDILDDARPARSPTHRLFDWDADIAAQRWREHQARTLANCLRVVVRIEGRDEPEVIHALAAIQMGHGIDRNSGYVNVINAAPEERQALLRQLLSELRSLRRRYAALEAVVIELDGLIAKLQEAA